MGADGIRRTAEVDEGVAALEPSWILDGALRRHALYD